MVETEACPNHRLTVLGHINELNQSVSHCYPEQKKPVRWSKEESVSAGAFSPALGQCMYEGVKLFTTKIRQTKRINYKAITLLACCPLTCLCWLTSVCDVRSISVGRRSVIGAYQQRAIKSVCRGTYPGVDWEDNL